MKSLSYIIPVLFVCIVCRVCTNNDGFFYPHAETNNSYNKKDTIIISEKVPEIMSGDCYEVEYSVRINSTFYPPAILISRIQDRLIVRIRSFVGDYSLDHLNDTNAVEKVIGCDCVKSYMSSEEQYGIIDMILKRASKDFELNNVQAVILMISSFEEEAQQITEEYRNIYGLKSKVISNKGMAEIIKGSRLYQNLGILFNHYSIKMGQVYVEDPMWISDHKHKGSVSNCSFYILDAGVIITTANYRPLVK